MSTSVDIAVQRINRAFTLGDEPLPVLDQVTFDVAAGEFVALLGASGCGKSTLLRLVAGLDRGRTSTADLVESIIRRGPETDSDASLERTPEDESCATPGRP